MDEGAEGLRPRPLSRFRVDYGPDAIVPLFTEERCASNAEDEPARVHRIHAEAMRRRKFAVRPVVPKRGTCSRVEQSIDLAEKRLSEDLFERGAIRFNQRGERAVFLHHVGLDHRRIASAQAHNVTNGVLQLR